LAEQAERSEAKNSRAVQPAIMNMDELSIERLSLSDTKQENWIITLKKIKKLIQDIKENEKRYQKIYH